jgi:imidazolonepropionase-like amidohydrolase
LTRKTIMPTLIDTHTHPGLQRGLSYAIENQTRETILEELNRLLYFGVGAVQSQGLEKSAAFADIRAEQEAGRLGGALLRISGRGNAPRGYYTGMMYDGIISELTTEDEAKRAMEQLAAERVDMVKIWVDARKTAPKLPPALYRRIIDEAHKRGLRVAAHVAFHADAEGLVEAGVDGFIHLVRDRELDAALVAAIVKRGVYVGLTLNDRGTYIERPPWLREDAPMLRLMRESVPGPVVERIIKSFEGRQVAAVEEARARYAILQRNTARLANANARIVIATDAGLQDNLLGVAEHLELETMVGAGMTPMQAIVAGTSRAAEFLKLDGMGTLAPGKVATFLVLDGNPLERISNTQRIAAVYVRGVEVDRPALARSTATLSN